MNILARRERVERAVQEHAPDILGYFLRRVVEREDAADLLAETLLVLWRRSRALPASDEQVRLWMFGVARNVLMHYQRSGARQYAVVQRLRGMLDAAVPAVDPMGHDDLRRALATLDQVDREIIGLLHWEGFPLSEIAELLGMKQSTVRSRYHRAKAKLREQLAVEGERWMQTRVQTQRR